MNGPRLSIIPARAATDPALKPRDLQVLCVLGRHTDELGWCRKSQVKMSDEMGCARATVYEAIERLVKAGYLERYVQEEQNGRDSPHVYRVILDPKHPDPSSVRDADFDGVDPAAMSAPPAGIPAPPAGPRPAPPAGSGPAPKNDSSRTFIQNDIEKEREREENQKAVKVWLKKTHPSWPSFVSDSEPKALAAALALTDEERTQAADRMADYLASAKVGGRTVICTFAVYLSEKRWQKLPEKVSRPAQTDGYGPAFGPVWAAWRMLRLLNGPEIADATTPESRWPTVAAVHVRARRGQGHDFGERFHALKPLMVAVPVGSDMWQRWQAEHLVQGWPWLPDPGSQPVVYFPAGGPEGLEAFKADVARGSQDDANGREAAA
ncbi:MAG TPA: helix-turn-helix domain-containing protein [Mesorhizobium sp.]|jgi:hypothetical protein|uniref:helix-turn-helix domain-containing protein n=1 Tax=Mesorhizobium sp. TaxID=1871066 RepID=UPI002DDD7FCE|nr:helix-turn-helix domain-containing protein [Mesorhizobium sp.]HEV2502347.1 helix-turn-helix domain-containing protein [Mesorhizobium sp.]